jgi:hypothetical protein
MARNGRALGLGGLVTLFLLASARESPATERPAGCRAPLEPWIQIDLHLGRDISTGGIVSERAFRRFVGEVVTPRFPDGLGIIDFTGQYRHAHGVIVQEPSKLLTILVPDAAAVAAKIEQIIAAYKRRFRQESVLHTETPTCVAFR